LPIKINIQFSANLKKQSIITQNRKIPKNKRQ
jgi:hypothetical protein